MPGAIGLLPRPLAYSAHYISLLAMKKPPGTDYPVSAGSRVDNQRNLVVQSFLSGPGEWLMFVDDDHLLGPSTLMDLLAHDVPIVTGLYMTRLEPVRTTQMIQVPGDEGYRSLSVEEINEAKKRLLPIDATGMGTIVIRREVFEKVPPPWFRVSLDEKTGKVTGEDVYFCRKAKAAGFEILLDANVRPGHLTPRGMKLSDENRLMFEQSF